ncbi:acyl carrier protein [Lichenicoccus sp.]|uniref:acyl carrier protein n=1 Tax=Lichenicoccus sp. TaxID=2781899 RepID=UPI003D1429BA
MSDDEILRLLTAIFRDIFDDPAIVLDIDTTADDIPGWDSFSQVTLATELSVRLAMTFKTAEVGALRSVSQLATLIRSRAARRPSAA